MHERGLIVTEEKPLPPPAPPDAAAPQVWPGSVEPGPSGVLDRPAPAQPGRADLSRPRQWLVTKIHPGFEVVAECETFAAIGDPGDATAVIDYHNPTGTAPVRITMNIVKNDRPSQWALRITWVRAGQVAYLDQKGGCRGCGRQIVGARVTDEGRVIVWHIE